MKKKRMWIFISIAVLAVFSVGVGFYLYLNSSKVIFTKSIEKAVDSLFDSEEKGLLADLDYDTLKVNTATKAAIASGDINYAFNMNGSVGYDESNKKVYMDLNTTANNQKLIDFEGMLEKNKLYFRIKDLMTKFYYIDMQIDSSEQIDEDDLDHMSEILKDSFFDNLKDKDFTKSKKTIELSGKSFSTTKISLKLTEEKLYVMCTDFLNSIKDDKEAMEIIQKVYPEFTEENIEDALTALNDSKKDANDDNYILYTIYVDKHKNILKQEISINDTENSYEGMSVVINSYETENDYQNLELIFVLDEMEVIKLSLNQVSKEETTLAINSVIVKAEGTIKNNDTENSYDIVVTDTTGNKLGNITYALTKVDSKKYTYNLNVNFAVEDIKASVISNNTILLDEQLSDFDVTNSQSIDTMSETEQVTIMNEIGKRLEKIMQ